MAVIINIETSTDVCSAALTAEGQILTHYEAFGGRNHARDEVAAVAVSMGPGSYTGLRIGLSEAKGLAYALDVPLIGVSTLELMATRVMFSTLDIDPETIFWPLFTARRMEVYTAAYDFGLSRLMEPQPLILDETSYGNLIATGRPVLFFGNGSDKARTLLEGRGAAEMVPDVVPLAVDMVALSELKYSRREFLDLAYSVPEYLKEFQATKPKALF